MLAGLLADLDTELLVVNELDQDLRHLPRRRGVEARHAMLDLGVDVGLRDQRDPERPSLEPAQVALAAIPAGRARRRQAYVHHRHRRRVALDQRERDAERAALPEDLRDGARDLGLADR